MTLVSDAADSSDQEHVGKQRYLSLPFLN